MPEYLMGPNPPLVGLVLACSVVWQRGEPPLPENTGQYPLNWDRASKMIKYLKVATHIKMSFALWLL